MKISSFSLLAVIALGFISCKKDEGPKSVVGTWEGTWGNGYEIPSYYEKWELEKDGELSSLYPDGSLYATGSWETDGEDFEAYYTPLGATYSYRFTGQYDEADDEISGTWVEVQDPTNGGTFEMSRE